MPTKLRSVEPWDPKQGAWKQWRDDALDVLAAAALLAMALVALL
jgi:hypothetical protein